MLNSKLKTQNLKDYHCHILPAIDDGAADPAEALAMARILAAAGFREVHCTPHLIKGAYETSPASVREAVANLQQALDDAGIPLRLKPGMEYSLDEFLLNYLADPLPLGDSSMVLVEAPFQAAPPYLAEIMYQVIRRGFTPLIAHPERCEVFHDNAKLKTQNSELRGAKLLDTLRDMGCLFQGNIGSFAGFYGERVRRHAQRFLEMGLYTHLGSDAHDSRHLERNLTAGLATISRIIGTERDEALPGGR